MAMRLGAGRLPSQNAWRSALAGFGFAATHIPAIAHLGKLRVGCNGEKKRRRAQDQSAHKKGKERNPGSVALNPK